MHLRAACDLLGTVLQLEDDAKGHKRVRVDQFPVGSHFINELMAKVVEEVKLHPAVLKDKLYQVSESSAGTAWLGHGDAIYNASSSTTFNKTAS